MTLLIDDQVSDAAGGSADAWRIENGRLRLQRPNGAVTLHPMWLRERTTSPGSVDATNRQRLFEPLDISADLAVVHVEVDGANGLVITFSDGDSMVLPHTMIDSIGAPSEALPEREPWRATDTAVPMIDHRRLCDDSTRDDEMIRALDAFFRLGFFMLRSAPVRPGALHEIAAQFGRVSATNFGDLFDVRTEAVPSDLAYTPVALSAHTDQPYRRPTPGLQFLHTIVNDAPGGESTVVDGLAAVEDLAIHDPEAFDVLSTLPVEFRYDIGTDVKTAHAPMIELRPDGTLRQLRFSPRLDFAPAVDADVLDVYYRGRRRLAEQLNSAERQIEVRMEAGDVLVVDNHRVLHGRRSFDPTRGSRHLQGCYIDHDGPETEWRLAMRRRTVGSR